MEANDGAVQCAIHVPKVTLLSGDIYGLVDRSNQRLAYYNSEFRSVRKQSRVFDNLCEMYVLVKGHTLWRNMEGNASLSQSEFQFSIIRHFQAMCRTTNGTKDSLQIYIFSL